MATAANSVDDASAVKGAWDEPVEDSELGKRGT